jgi:hypothetical protein
MEADFRECVQFTDDRRDLLLSLLDAPAEEATLALDILFTLDLTSVLLARCWEVLRSPDHTLADAVREKLGGVNEIKGERSFLAVLDDGRRDAALRTISLELVRKVSWCDAPTFAQALAWLGDEDPDVRCLAALLLAAQDDLLSLPRAVLVTSAYQSPRATEAGWAALRDDVPLVRLLGGLWLHDWDEALTQLWVTQPAVTYIDQNHPSEYWRDFRSYPESEACVRWLLEQAQFGQTLIPIFLHASAHLVELEGDSVQGPPEQERIAAVLREIGEKIDALLGEPATPPLLRAEAAILAGVAHGETVPPVSAATLHAALDSPGGTEWVAALARLAAEPNQRSVVVAALDQAFVCADRKRRLLALTVLSSHKALRAALAETLETRYTRQPAAHDEALIALGLLLELKPPPAALHPWLRSLDAWLRNILAANGLAPDAPPATLAGLLTDEDAETRRAASTALLAADLPALLVPVVGEAAQSLDDRTRMKGEQQLYSLCAKLATDGSTEAVRWLPRFERDTDAKKDGRLGTLSQADAQINHTHPFWVARWLEAFEQDTEPAREEARRGLNGVHRVSPDVLSFLCAALNDPGRPLAARGAVADALAGIMESSPSWRTDPTIQAALTAALCDADACSAVRRNAAYALRWTAGQGAWPVAQALLRAAECDPDGETRALALRFAGRLLNGVRGVWDVDVSKDGLFRWLESQGNPDVSVYLTEAVNELANLTVLKEAPDAAAALDSLAHLDTLGLLEENAASLRGAQAWDELLHDARHEWEVRHYWRETLPHLPGAIAQVQALLAAPEPAMRRASACALARLYHGDDDRPSRLRDLLPDDGALLHALVDAVTDHDCWVDDSENSVSYQPWAVKDIAAWVEARPTDERAQLIAAMLDDLETTMVGMERRDEDDDDLQSGWPARRALVAVLAELSERLTYRAFTSAHELVDVVALIGRAAADPESYTTRRFSIRILGNLQQLTDHVADVFFVACQDVSTVYRETRTAVSKFKAFGPGSLERLTTAIRSPSITVAYHAALLLGELGVTRSEELGREGRERVADELVQLLDDPSSERIVYDFSKSSEGDRVGPLYDVIYEALMRVVAGPDAPTSQAAATIDAL